MMDNTNNKECFTGWILTDYMMRNQKKGLTIEAFGNSFLLLGKSRKVLNTSSDLFVLLRDAQNTET